MTQFEFQVSVSILFVGYVLMQVPSNLWLNKMGKPAIYLPTCVRGYSQNRRIRTLTADLL